MSDSGPTDPPMLPGALAHPLRLLAAATRRFQEADCGQRAAAIAYYALMSFFPFIILLGSVASLFVGADAAEIRQAMGPLETLLPRLQEGFWERAQDLVERRQVLSIFSVLLLAFLATRVTVSVQRALRPIFAATGQPPRPRRRASKLFLAHGMTVGALLVFGAMLTAIAVLEVMLRRPSSPIWLQDAIHSALFTRHAIPIVLLALLAYALFAVLPEVRLRRRHRLAAALFFGVAHDVAVSAWAGITGRIAPSDVIYGSFVGAVSFAGWTWVAASLLLLSATVAAELSSAEAQSSAPRPSRARRRSARR